MIKLLLHIVTGNEGLMWKLTR